MLENMLSIGLVYKGTVQSISPCARDFTNKHTNKINHCHDIILQVDAFPGLMYNAQLCNEMKGIPDFEVGSYINFKATAHHKGEDRYTIKFESNAFKPQQKKETFGAAPQTAETNFTRPPIDAPSYPARNEEPSIMGKPWSVCLTAATNFHNDRPKSTAENVIETMKVFLSNYNEYIKNSEEWLKKSNTKTKATGTKEA